MDVLGRFAPSPSGRMHLGNLFCALLVWLSARQAGGRVLLRVLSSDADVFVPDEPFTNLDQETIDRFASYRFELKNKKA